MIWVIWLIYYSHILGVNRYDEYTVARKSTYTYSSFAIKLFLSYSTFHFHSIKILLLYEAIWFIEELLYKKNHSYFEIILLKCEIV